MEAQQKAKKLFEEIENRGLITAGKSENEVSARIFDLAKSLFGIDKYWHKKIVRAGENTILPYDFNPPDRIVQNDDIVWVDFGPIFEEWEADFGRTYVIGNDPNKLRIKNDVQNVWHQCKNMYVENQSISGAEFYAYACASAQNLGWAFGSEIAGHLIDQFSHHKIHSRDQINYICAENPSDLKTNLEPGKERIWILEIHLVDPQKQFGAFYEELLI
ncbi:M24 family metallopeptidase [Leptospira sp. WS92.C1]